MACLYALVFLLLLPLDSIAALIETPIASLPTSTVAGATRIVIDGATEDDCSLGGGVYSVLCTFDGISTWVPGGGSTAPAVTLDQAFDNGQEIDNATTANPMIVGNGTQKVEIFGDATMGGTIRPSPLGDSLWRIWANFNGCIRDEAGAANMLCINPGAATTRLMGEYMAGYRPRGYFFVGAGAFTGDGTNCPTSSSAVTINSGPKVQAVICGSGANGDMDFDVVMPMDWDGGDLIFEPTYRQTAANTSAMNSDIKAQCRGAGETPSSTWGTSVNIDDAAVTGSNAEDKTASAAVTPAGTCAAGDHLFVRYTLDVTGTTTPEATLQFEGMGVYYNKRYWGN